MRLRAGPPGINSRMGYYHRLVDGYDRLFDGVARTRTGAWIAIHLFNPLDKRLMCAGRTAR